MVQNKNLPRRGSKDIFWDIFWDNPKTGYHSEVTSYRPVEFNVTHCNVLFSCLFHV